MKNIPYIFSDGSLFQADSDITITGETEKTPYSILDFEKFAGMSFYLYNMNDKRGEMIITTWEKDDVVHSMEKADNLGGDFERYMVRFGALPESKIRKITFMFYSEKKGYDFINVKDCVF